MSIANTITVRCSRQSNSVRRNDHLATARTAHEDFEGASLGADGWRGTSTGSGIRAAAEAPRAMTRRVGGGTTFHLARERLTRPPHWRASASAPIRLLSNVLEADVAVAGLGRKT